MATITFGSSTGTGFPSHPALEGGGSLQAYAQAIANAVSRIGKPTFLVNGSSTPAAVSVTWDNTTNVISVTLS